MKRLIYTISTTYVLFFRPGPNKEKDKLKERIKAQKVAFITERLDLSSKEAQQFWPIYNAFEDKIDDMRKNDLKEVRQAMRRGNLSESEAQQDLRSIHESRRQNTRCQKTTR